MEYLTLVEVALKAIGGLADLIGKAKAGATVTQADVQKVLTDALAKANAEGHAAVDAAMKQP